METISNTVEANSPEFNDRQKGRESQLRMEEEAARIQSRHHRHKRTAKQPTLDLPSPVEAPVNPRKTAAAARKSRTPRERRQRKLHKDKAMTEKPSAPLSGTVEMTIKSTIPSEPEKAQIAVGGGDHPYKIRIENALTNENGEEFRLKPGAKVEITIRNGGNH